MTTVAQQEVQDLFSGRNAPTTDQAGGYVLINDQRYLARRIALLYERGWIDRGMVGVQKKAIKE
jgi:hypothetical protein